MAMLNNQMVLFGTKKNRCSNFQIWPSRYTHQKMYQPLLETRLFQYQVRLLDGTHININHAGEWHPQFCRLSPHLWWSVSNSWSVFETSIPAFLIQCECILIVAQNIANPKYINKAHSWLVSIYIPVDGKRISCSFRYLQRLVTIHIFNL